MKTLELKFIIEAVRKLNNSMPLATTGLSDNERSIDPSELAAMVVGAAIGCHCPIPPRSVPLTSAYFSTNHGTEVRATLSAINEAVTIRTQIAYDAALSIWTDRYDMVHRRCNADNLLLRLAQSDQLTNTNFTKGVMCSLDDVQKAALQKIVTSVNMSCSPSDASKNIFDQ